MLHIAASRGQLRFVKKILWSLYHKLGSTEAAYGTVQQMLNSPGGKRGQGVADMALGANVQCAEYLKATWGAREQLENPRKRGQGYY